MTKLFNSRSPLLTTNLSKSAIWSRKSFVFQLQSRFSFAEIYFIFSFVQIICISSYSIYLSWCNLKNYYRIAKLITKKPTPSSILYDIESLRLIFNMLCFDWLIECQPVQLFLHSCLMPCLHWLLYVPRRRTWLLVHLLALYSTGLWQSAAPSWVTSKSCYRCRMLSAHPESELVNVMIMIESFM